MDTVVEGESATNYESSVDICPPPRVTASGHLLNGTGSPVWCSVMTWRSGVGWGGREVLEGEGICVHTADSLPPTVETNTTL